MNSGARSCAASTRVDQSLDRTNAIHHRPADRRTLVISADWISGQSKGLGDSMAHSAKANNGELGDLVELHWLMGKVRRLCFGGRSPIVSQ